MKKMKKPYSSIKAICTIAMILLMQTSFAQEVDTQQQTNTDATTVTDESSSDVTQEEGHSDLTTKAARASEPGNINGLQWDVLTPTSPSSIFTTTKSYNSVDMSTGKVNVKVPITTVGTPDLQIPIGLNYTTGGIKLRDVASWVGLGWNLSAGGKITRMLNRFPDTYDGSMTNLLDSLTWTCDVYDFTGNYDERLKDKDTQPDLFYFEIPGKSGMFVLDAWGNAATIPYQNVKINYDKTTEFFEIIDDLGNRYFFQDIETTKIETQYKINRPIVEHPSTWYLSSISNIKGDFVFFEYKTTNNKYLYRTESRSMTIFANDPMTDSPSLVEYTTSISPKYLTKISWEDGYVEFLSSYNRLDITEQQAFQLDAIKLYSGDESASKLVKSYNLEYDSFANDALKLNKITVSTDTSVTPEFFRKFEYFTDQNLPYLSIGLENYYYPLDHWGYYNQDKRDAVGIARISNIFQTGIQRTGFDNRTPSLAFTRANSLKKIWVTSSGYEEFEYELNTSKSMDVVGGLRIKSITTKSGELGNVAQKVRYEYVDENNKSTGVVFNEPIYYYLAARTIFDKYDPNKIGNCGFGDINYVIVSGSPLISLFDLDGSHIRYGRVKELFDNGSSNTYYFTTKEEHPDEGYRSVYNILISSEKLNFDILKTYHRNFAPVNTRFWKRGLLTEKISRDALGQETCREEYEYNFNAPIQKTVQGVFPFVSETVTYKEAVIVTIPYLVYYDYISQPIYMTKKIVSGIDIPEIITTYTYDRAYYQLQNKTEMYSGDTYETKYKYPYNYNVIGSNNHVITFMKKNNILATPIEIIQYKNDYVIGGELRLYDTWKYMYNGSIMGGTYFNLKEIKELVLKTPKSAKEFTPSYYNTTSQTFLYDDCYVTKAIYEYNYNNKLGCIKERNKPSQSFIYDDSKTLPIAQITNAEAKILSGAYCQEALHTSFEGDNGRTHARAKTGSKVLNGSYYIRTRDFVPGNYLVSYWVSNNDGVDWELYKHEMAVVAGQDLEYPIGGRGITDELRVHKKDALMQTKTYDLNKNVTSETDANGKTAYYEYDAFGRLITIKDNNRNKLKSYQYFIKK